MPFHNQTPCAYQRSDEIGQYGGCWLAGSSLLWNPLGNDFSQYPSQIILEQKMKLFPETVFFLFSLAVACPAQAQGVMDIVREAVRQGAPIALPNIGISSPETAGRPPALYDPEVARIQELLNRAGFSAGRPDGISGPGTQRAIMAFQRSIGHQPTGVLSGPERQVLENAGASPNQEVDIARVQRLLLDLGYDVGSADGIWGARSRTALAAFRKAQAVTREGGPVWADIEAMEAALAPTDARPATTGPTTHYVLEQDGYRLLALPLVDRGMLFHASWSGAHSGPTRLVIVETDTGPTPGTPYWEVSAGQTAPLTAPAAPGRYDLALVDPASGTVVLRKPLEVR
jgi:hypothetical protein